MDPRAALELGLAGHARNTEDGRVEIVAEGTGEALATLLELLREEPSTTGRPGTVRAVDARLANSRGAAGFVAR